MGRYVIMKIDEIENGIVFEVKSVAGEAVEGRL